MKPIHTILLGSTIALLLSAALVAQQSPGPSKGPGSPPGQSGNSPSSSGPYSVPGGSLWEPPTTVASSVIPESEALASEQVEIEQDCTHHVLPHSGEFCLTVQDLRIPGVLDTFPFVWERKYRSRLGADTPMGNGWDHSYNLWLRQEGTTLIVHDGSFREKRYFKRGSKDEWAAPGLFDLIERNGDGSFTLFNRHANQVEFAPLSHATHPGKASRILDRLGNELRLQYDTQGRLEAIVDSLGRTIDIRYDAQGYISEVEDFATDLGVGGKGRIIRYTYYQTGESGGPEGTLKSVTYPAVIGTPNNNDFPNGKTWTYTYSKGHRRTALNGNLLTITDGRNQTYLTNTYGVYPRKDIRFDRVIKQELAHAGGVSYDYAYEPLSNPRDYNGASLLAIVNDRKGHVKQLGYDSGNHLVYFETLTGTANASQPTTLKSNRPGGPIRQGDPASWTRRFWYNADSLLVRVVEPEGNWRRMKYDSRSASPRSRGNLRIRRRFSGRRGGDQSELCETWAYNTLYNFKTAYKDPNGYVTTWEYSGGGVSTTLPEFCDALPPSPDPRDSADVPVVLGGLLLGIICHGLAYTYDSGEPDSGCTCGSSGRCWDYEYDAQGRMIKRTNPMGRQDELIYYASGPMNGYLHQYVQDSVGARLTWEFTWDTAGNASSVMDPQGHLTSLHTNALNQVVRRVSPAPFLYEIDFFFNENDKLVKRDVQNKDENNQVGSNSHFTTSYVYDVLDNVIQRIEEVDDTRTITTTFSYDANENEVLIQLPEATAGRQSDNAIAREFDERNLLFLETRGASGSDKSTMQYDYDGNKNAILILSGLEGAVQIEAHDFDGFDRRVWATDSMGNELEIHYDPNSKEVSRRVHGEELDETPGSTSNVLLSEVVSTYDDWNRLIQADVSFFERVGGSRQDLPKHPARAELEYNCLSQVTVARDDNGRVTEYRYDRVNRLEEILDAEQNSRKVTEFDRNSNLKKVLEHDDSDLGASFDLDLVTQRSFDALNRVTSITDNVNRVWQLGYDSRDNVVRVVDPKGNVTIHRYDGLNRRIEVEKIVPELTDGKILMQQKWDDSSRLIAQTDDEGRTTRYAYDGLDRPIVSRRSDGGLHQAGSGASWPAGQDRPNLTSFVSGYDVHGNLMTITDANGSVVQSSYDRLNRVTQRTITPGAGVSSDTTQEEFDYDGLGRVVRASDDDSEVVRRYDSMGNVLEESLSIQGAPAQTTISSHDGERNLLSCTYPGGRQVNYTFDGINRISRVSDQTIASLAIYRYLGPYRVQRRDFASGVRMDAQFDGIRRTSSIDHHENTVSRAKLSFGWDENSNKTSRTDDLTGFRRDYGYDSADRLVQSIVWDDLNVKVEERDYALDGVHNREQVTGMATTPEMGSYLTDVLNFYTQTPTEDRTRDANGNQKERTDGLTSAPLASLEYDYRDRMVRFTDHSSGAVNAYRYDAFGRRIAKLTDLGGMSEKETRFFYDERWQVVEEQDALGVTLATYVFGNGVDEVLNMQRDVDGLGGPEDYYFHTDDLNSVFCLTDESGAVVERYEYGDFGRPEILNPDRTPSGLEASAFGNPYLFTGRRWDGEAELYLYRTRYLDPVSGRFTTVDRIGVWGDALNFGNGYAYVANNPGRFVDPFGEQHIDIPTNAKKTGDALKALEAYGKQQAEFGGGDAGHTKKYKNAVKSLEKRGGKTLARAGRNAYKKGLNSVATQGAKRVGGFALRAVPIFGTTVTVGTTAAMVIDAHTEHQAQKAKEEYGRIPPWSPWYPGNRLNPHGDTPPPGREGQDPDEIYGPGWEDKVIPRPEDDEAPGAGCASFLIFLLIFNR